MKLIFTIVGRDDANQVSATLTKERYMVTKIGSKGGFLGRRNTTLMIGVKDEEVPKVLAIIKRECGKREEVAISTLSTPAMVDIVGTPMNIEVGGAVVFVVDVEQFERL